MKRMLMMCCGLMLMFSCTSMKIEEDKIEQEVVITEDIVEPLFETQKIDTLGINEYWSQQDIETATLYVYDPMHRIREKNGNLIVINSGELSPFIIDSLT